MPHGYVGTVEFIDSQTTLPNANKNIKHLMVTLIDVIMVLSNSNLRPLLATTVLSSVIKRHT